MMKVITARNVSNALILGLSSLNETGVQRSSRNGPVRRFTGPVTTEYSRPDERVLFFPARDANPYFHFMESLWMMAGRNDVEWVSQFNSGMVNYSDDGVKFHGAYGHRWRCAETLQLEQEGGFTVELFDQLETIANLLIANPDDRRIVLQMWNADMDLGKEGKDFPCNLMATFSVNPYGNLDMTVFNRSNDMIWGAYGANAVHFSVLQEIMAAWIGVPLGSYYQVSTNFHCYENTLDKHSELLDECPGFDPYSLDEVTSIPIVNGPIEDWFNDLEMFMSVGSPIGFKDKFFKKTAVPMLLSWQAWKDREDPMFMTKALQHAKSIEAPDWRRACVEWLERRLK